MSKTILYARVSTAEQHLDHQLARAQAAGFIIDEVIADNGTSGVSTRLKERVEGRRLFDVLREGDTLVVRWIDRLGRNYTDVTETVRQLLTKGVTIKTVINGMTFDGAATDPMSMAVRDALLGFMAAMAQAQAEVTKEAQAAGIEAAKAKGVYKGRKPAFTRDQLNAVLEALSASQSPSAISKTTGVSRQGVYRIQADPEKANMMLMEWGE